MSDVNGDRAGFDPEAVRAKYRAERDKRVVKGRAAIRDLTRDEVFAKYRADPFTPVTPRDPVVEDVDVAIIGAGMAGVVAGAQLRKAGLDRIRLIDQRGRYRRDLVLEPLSGCDVRCRVVLLHADARGDGVRPEDALRLR